MAKNSSRREAAKAKAEAAQQQLADSVEQLHDPEAWARYLDWAGRFHKYSWGNIMLIMLQRPDATRVAGFRKWQELGRQVRKGEKGLTILAPRTGPCRDCKGEGTGCSRCGGRGRYLYFTTATVFDIGQTDGDEVPAPPVPDAQLLTGGDAAMFDRLAELLTPAGWTVEVGSTAEAGPGVNGFCQHDRRRIVIAEDRDPAHRVKTLLHELAHASLHDPAVVDYTAERGRCEVEAESVAHVVLAGLGLDTTGYSLGYVTGWANGDAQVLRAAAQRVLGEARRMLDVLIPEEGAEQGQDARAMVAA